MQTRLALAVLLIFAAPAFGAADQTKEERKALKTVEKKLLALAKYALIGKDFAAARAELDLALNVAPKSKRLKREVERVEKKANRKRKARAPKAKFLAKLTKKRTEAHLAVSLLLAKAAQATEKDHPKRYSHYLNLIQSHFPSVAALKTLNLVRFEPYYKLVSQTENKLLKSGGERLGGKDLSPTRVRTLNTQHANWSNPWVISDEVHEVRTTLPLRKARRILAYVSAYRRYFLQRFGDVWDLKAPTGKLPVIVTATQAELKEQMAKITGAAQAQQGMQGAAFYLQSTGSLNPCFVTLEPMQANGTTFSINKFEELWIPIAHEVTHQIAFEYSKHDANATRQISNQFWSVEAIANYMGYHSYDGREWTLKHPRTIPMGQGMIEGPFAHCVNNVSSLPLLRDFTQLTRQRFLTVNNYHVAATLAYFLLEGEGGKYRKQFVKLLQTVHRVKDSSNTWDQSFKGVDRDKMQREWLKFVKNIKLD
jgi:hypothetical protein